MFQKYRMFCKVRAVCGGVQLCNLVRHAANYIHFIDCLSRTVQFVILYLNVLQKCGEN